MTYGWSDPEDILTIPLDNMRPNKVRNLLEDYGTFGYESIRQKELSYIDIESRLIKDTSMLYRYIINSLTDEGSAKLNMDEELYT